MLIEAKIKTVVDERGIKYSWIADKTGVSRRKFYDILHGRQSMPVDLFAKIANLLEIPVSELLEGVAEDDDCD